MRELVVEQVATGQGCDPFHVRPVGRDDPERCLEILVGQDEPASAILVGDSQDDERVGVRALGKFAVGPGIDGPSAMEVDMRTQDTTKSRRFGLARDRGRAGSMGAFEELVELARRALSVAA